MAATRTRALTVQIDARVYPRLEERARALGYAVTKYAQLLFDAAYLARVQRERGGDIDDRELDRQVVTVFALAAAGPEEISVNTGIPASTVRKILEGWHKFGEASSSSQAEPDKAPEAAAAAPPPVAAETPKKATRGKKYSPEDIQTIRRMWADGAAIAAIAKAVGRNYATVQVWISNHRDACPRRR